MKRKKEKKNGSKNGVKTKKLKRATKAEKEIILKDLKVQMDEAIRKWEFEKAALIRDQIKEIS